MVDDVIERSLHAQDLGADALMILPPYLEGPEDDDGLLAFYASIDARLNTDIIGYNIPQTTGVAISLSLFKRLNQLEHFNYIKDSAGDLTTHQEYLATGHRVLNGCDPNTCTPSSPAPTAASGAAPTTCREKASSCMDWSPATYPPRWRCGNACSRRCCIWRGNYIAKVKAASRQRGFDAGAVRAPLRDLNNEEAAELAASLEPLG